MTAGNPNGGVKRFGAGDSITFLVTGASALDAADLLNGSGGSHGQLIGGTHVISVGANADGSAKIGLGFDGLTLDPTSVPEPHTYLLLFGLGILGFAVVRRRLGRQR